MLQDSVKLRAAFLIRFIISKVSFHSIQAQTQPGGIFTKAVQLQSAAVLVDDVAELGEVASCLLENIHSQNSPFIQFRPKPGLGVFYMFHRFFLATEIVSIVHAIQSDELANIPDMGLQHVFHNSTSPLLSLRRALRSRLACFILACQSILAADQTSQTGDAAVRDRCDVYYWPIMNKV